MTAALRTFFILTLLSLFNHLHAQSNPKVLTGIDRLFTEEFRQLIAGKRIGLITNQTAINHQMESSISLFKRYQKDYGYRLTALFAPEHGIFGAVRAEKFISDTMDKDGVTVFSLYGKTKRPTEEMLNHVDILIYDIQDIGSRSYTYISTLFYVMEEAAKRKIPVIVLDRPNPINGLTIDGPMLEERWRSIVGYINVPYCHGMTTGELARFFNQEYKINCPLTVIPMKGWKRKMTFQETGLPWIPTSPHIPEAQTVWYYPTTGILGELSIVSIGVGYTLPFKVVGAPWIDADAFAKQLNDQKFPGVHFFPFHFQPFYGLFAKEECHGVMISIVDPSVYQPVSTQYLILGVLKNLYPDTITKALHKVKHRKEMFCKVNGTEEVYNILTNEKYIIWKLKKIHEKEKQKFLKIREKYLLPNYTQTTSKLGF